MASIHRMVKLFTAKYALLGGRNYRTSMSTADFTNGGDLGHLHIRVRAGISGEGNQRVDLAVLDVQRVQNWFPKKMRPAQAYQDLWRTAEVRSLKRWS